MMSTQVQQVPSFPFAGRPLRSSSTVNSVASQTYGRMVSEHKLKYSFQFARCTFGQLEVYSLDSGQVSRYHY